ncbi:Na-translocating system protein MpsC family protein [Virgibacillus necropolis]|uniref:Na+-translocating membrane potential-generating system MpsC domain-containing protein n=1 Tax=Virgibacillus necropolis TaxID=163877 RepID=A0A221M8P4_9BACI|nr:Na-translocating system protein MpsC family protein [Virgibacillus necropolis]ASN03999.1 hypothetical protein CFK40_02785 [Virgibacillus necropolis]
MQKKTIEADIASYVGKLFRDNFGKGPGSIYVSVAKPFITIHLRDFLAPLEHVLINQKEDLKVQETRDIVMQELIPEIKDQLKAILSIDIENIYYDWSLVNKTGLILAIENTIEVNVDPDYLSYPAKEKVHEEIARFTKKAQKEPKNIESFMLNSRTLVSVREDILVRIEKELIKSGFGEQLKLSKRGLEKDILNTDFLESILDAEIEDAFVDWDFDLDKGFLILVLKEF